MRTAKEFSVSLVNKPGRMATILTALGREKVNLMALAVMDSSERGILRFLPSEPESAEEALNGINVRFDTHEVLLVEVANNSGAFAKTCERLAAEHMNIDYAYCSANAARGGKSGTLAVIKVNDPAKAQRILGEPGTSTRNKRPGRRPMHAR